MDKAEFIERAPDYYALAVISHLLRDMCATTKDQIVDDYSYRDPDDPSELLYCVRDGKLFDVALQKLIDAGLITIDNDDFGPAIINPAEEFQIKLLRFKHTNGAPYTNFMSVGRTKDRWLRTALNNLVSEGRRLNITDKDFENPEAEWAPIAVDRNQPETKAVILAFEDVAERIRTSNGYSATRPTERAYVLAGLHTFLALLKEASTVSIPFIRKFAVEPLLHAGKSMGKSAAGIAVEVAKAKLKEWLMKQSISWPWD